MSEILTEADDFVVIEKKNYRVTSMGLTPVRDLHFEEWEFLGIYLAQFQKGIQWALGDWLLYGERREDWKHTYTQALDQRYHDLGTLRNFRWVAGRFPPERRRKKVSWSHHALLAPLKSEEEQDRWLDKVEANGWSYRALRQSMAGHEPKGMFDLPPLESEKKAAAPAATAGGKKVRYGVSDLKVFFSELSDADRESFKAWVATQ